MKRLLRNEFMKWHAVFVVMYLATFSAGLLRGSSQLIYQIHPILGMSSLVLPLTYYLFTKNKRLIRQMIKSNFKLTGRTTMKVARLSTIIILIYYVFSVITGFLLNNGLYTSSGYLIIQSIHGAAKIIVPLAVLTHVSSRLLLKRK